MNDDKPFSVDSTRIAYENPWIKVREDKITRKNDASGIYGYLEVGESVAIVAVNDRAEICLVESYRHPFGGWFWELPGGGGEGDELVEASKKELEEEAGILADTWVTLGRARVCNGLSTEYQTNVLAMDLKYGDFMQHEDETRGRMFVPLEELDRMISDGRFQDNQSITALYMYKLWLEQEARSFQ